MDPPIINEALFSAANPSSYSLAEIWPFLINGNAGVGEPSSGGALGLRMSNLSGFEETTSNRDLSVDESTITEQSGSRGGGGGRRWRDANSEDESSKLVSTSSGNDVNNTNGKRMKISRSRGENGGSKSEVEANSRPGSKPAEQSTKPSEPPPKQDYIHVRARRGQATDSHSLAERARREKISERMKILQDLVPGCNKVIGKALVLDEIINYIQSLQHQVEFLSMKLQAVNSRMEPPIEGFPSKDFLSMKLQAVNSRMEPPIEGFPSKDLGASTFDAAGMIFGLQATRDYVQGSLPEWLHMQVGSSFD